jgi:polyphosphate kinase 2 (PPK2 family)
MTKKSKPNKPANAKSGTAGELHRDAEEVALLEGRWKILGDAKPPTNRPKKYQYVDELVRLQFELLKMQEWVRLRGLKVCVLFEGRDAAGKGGVIKRITECLNPRVCRVVALGTPRSGSDHSGISNATWLIFPPPGKSCSSIAAGITAPASSK